MSNLRFGMVALFAAALHTFCMLTLTVSNAITLIGPLKPLLEMRVTHQATACHMAAVMLQSGCALTFISVTIVCRLVADPITQIMTAAKYSLSRHFAFYVPCHSVFASFATVYSYIVQ